MLRAIFGEPVPECCLGVSSAKAGLEGKGVYASYTRSGQWQILFEIVLL